MASSVSRLGVSIAPRARAPSRRGAAPRRAGPSPAGPRDDDDVVPSPSRRAVALASVALLPLAPRRARAGVLSDALARSPSAPLPGFGFATYESPDLDFAFAYPRGWKVLRNRNRRGVVVADFESTEKIVVEIFSRPPMGELIDAAAASVGDAPPGSSAAETAALTSTRDAIRRRAVEVLVAPVADDAGGDSKLETPAMRGVRTLGEERRGAEGAEGAEGVGAGAPLVDYFTFTSETTTRSGYLVTRRNYAAAANRGGAVYAIDASCTTADFDAKKAETYERVVRSFVVNAK